MSRNERRRLVCDDAGSDVTTTQRRITDDYGVTPVDTEHDPLFAAFARQMKRLRTKRGLSQEALAKRIGYSGEMVSKVETRRNDPEPGVRRRARHARSLSLRRHVLRAGRAGRQVMVRHVRGRRARCRRDPHVEPPAVPGPGADQRVTSGRFTRRGATVDGNPEIDADVAARLERQSILDRATPPSTGIVVDETVLYRPIGGPKVMHDQLVHVADLTEHPRVTVQVLPADVGAHVGLLGAFVILSFSDDTPGMVYLGVSRPGRDNQASRPRRTANGHLRRTQRRGAERPRVT